MNLDFCQEGRAKNKQKLVDHLDMDFFYKVGELNYVRKTIQFTMENTQNLNAFA